jgi:hypothetical protein
MSCVHQGEVLNDGHPLPDVDIPTKDQQFILQHYTKSIYHLRPHFATNDRSSIRIALTTCIIFVYLEFLRGRFQTALIHLKNGLKVLRQIQAYSDGDGRIFLSAPSREVVDDGIVEAFFRLHVLVGLYLHTFQRPQLFLEMVPESLPLAFDSFKGAWQQLGRLINRVFHIAHLSRYHQELEASPNHTPKSLSERQRHVQQLLSQWKCTLDGSRQNSKLSSSDEKPWQLLYTCHSMASIMAGTCLSSADEMVYDSYTSQFLFLLKHSIDLWSARLARPPSQTESNHWTMKSRSIVDFAWIPPLYFLALKCRIPRLREHAIRLLETSYHREGIFDSQIAACVARQVMRLEENGFYEENGLRNDFLLSASPNLQDLSLPPLPSSQRIHEVQVTLSDSPSDRVYLLCWQRQPGGVWKTWNQMYCMRSRSWTICSVDENDAARGLCGTTKTPESQGFAAIGSHEHGT